VVCGFFGIAILQSRAAATSRGGIYFRPRILKDRAERCASDVRERIQPALAIVCDETPDGHGLHRMARMPTEAWSMPVAAQNKITRSCALSSVAAMRRGAAVAASAASEAASSVALALAWGNPFDLAGRGQRLASRIRRSPRARRVSSRMAGAPAQEEIDEPTGKLIAHFQLLA
jgi:hypothetical protein